MIIEFLVDISGSSDNSEFALKELAEDIPILQVVNVGKRDGLNNALDRLILLAKGELIARIDGDVSIQKGTLASLIGEFESERVGIVGPRVKTTKAVDGLLNLVMNGEYALHHYISKISPKTTNLQIFRNVHVGIPSGFEVDDILIQQQIEAKGYCSKYVENGTIWVTPPISFNQLFKQRIRCISQQRHYSKLSGRLSPTQSPINSIHSLLKGILSREENAWGMFFFAIFELFSRLYVTAKESLMGHKDFTTWDQVKGTKEVKWEEGES